MLKKIAPWVLAFAAAAILAQVPTVVAMDHAVGRWLRPLGIQQPWLNAVWILAGLPVTALAILVSWRWRRRAGVALLGLAAGSLIEVLGKHWILVTPPHPAPEPLLLARIENWTNLYPSQVEALLGLAGGKGRAVHHLVGGSFPSGHTFRLVYAAGWWIGRRPWTLLGIAAIVGVAVVATGGHWPWDVVGGYLLAQATLMAVGTSSLTGTTDVSAPGPSPR